jgi:hypothetical protein
MGSLRRPATPAQSLSQNIVARAERYTCTPREFGRCASLKAVLCRPAPNPLSGNEQQISARCHEGWPVGQAGGEGMEGT